MFQKLKRKLILLTMSLLTVVFIGVIGAIAVLMAVSNQKMTAGMLDRALSSPTVRELFPPDTERFPENGQNGRPPKFQEQDQMGKPFQQFPKNAPIGAVTALCSPSGEMLSVFAPPQLDEDLIDQAVQIAIQKGAAGKDGQLVLSGYHFAFRLEERDGNYLVALVDRSDQAASFRSTVMILSVVSVISLLILFVISVYFANRAVAPIKEAFEKQEEFIADASHELKTPLSVLSANLSVLKANSASTVESQKQWLSAMENQTSRMTGLIRDMLTLARIDARADGPLAEVSFGQILAGCLLSFEAITFERGIQMVSQVNEELPAAGNTEKLTRLIYILLDNAAKHTPSGGTITVCWKEEKGRLFFSVQNTGEGIPLEQLDHIFDRFYRSDSARTREEGGYGLGLSIARAILEECGGKIRAESTPGTSCTFTAEFPPPHKILRRSRKDRWTLAP